MPDPEPLPLPLPLPEGGLLGSVGSPFDGGEPGSLLDGDCPAAGSPFAGCCPEDGSVPAEPAGGDFAGGSGDAAGGPTFCVLAAGCCGSIPDAGWGLNMLCVGWAETAGCGVAGVGSALGAEVVIHLKGYWSVLVNQRV